MMKRVSNPFRVVQLQPCNPRYGYLRIGTPPVFFAYSTRSAAATNTRAAPPGLTPIESTMEDEKRKLLKVYFAVKSELLHDPDFHFTHTSRQWLHSMLDFNVPEGKLSRGLAVVNCHKLLHEGKVLSHEENFLAYVLAWCIEWFQACMLVSDDIIDNSYTCRGQPCWFRLPKVGLIATNDALLLQTHVPRILKKHFRGKPYYVQLLDLFNEVTFQTACGQMLDVITPLEGEKDLSNYSMELYLCITKYKSACYSLYLPVSLDDHLQVKDILVEITNYYQIQDDFLDCFGDAETTGKVGTDIEDGKCSWLIVKALEHADEEQKKILHDNYGKANPTCVAKVKEIYASLNLQNMYKHYEKKSFEALKKSVEAHPKIVVQVIWKVFLGRMIH